MSFRLSMRKIKSRRKKKRRLFLKKMIAISKDLMSLQIKRKM